MRVFSTFSGISAATVAWRPLGWVMCGYAEIAPFQCAVLAEQCGASAPLYLPEDMSRRNYRHIVGGHIPNFGDITQITDAELEALGPIDLLEGGSPCQPFSIAGDRMGLEDQRGNLMLEFVRLAERMKTINGLKYLVWENVKGVLSDATNGFGSLLGALVGEEHPLLAPGKRWSNSGRVHNAAAQVNIAWRTIDSQFWGVPQRRERVFLVANFGGSMECASSVLFDEGISGWSPESWAGEQQPRRPDAGEVHRIEAVSGFNARVAPTITANAGGLNRPAGQGNELQFIITQFVDPYRAELCYRRFMPKEVEQLQGFPIGWTDVEYMGKAALDLHRYKALGNSMSTPVMNFIGSQIDAVEKRKLAA